MLILTRKEGESIMVGDDIKIEVVQIRGGSIRIGIAAPENVNIARTELLVAEQPEHGSSQDDARMDCEGHEAPCFDHEPLIVAGKYSL